MDDKKIKKAVKSRYAEVAERASESCCPSCGCGTSSIAKARAEAVGYLKKDLESIPDEAVLGVGCGNPGAIAELREGEVVLDLGSGAGIDAFFAANKVGPGGRVIGVDMTEAMIARASSIARGHGYQNVEFRLGEIEKLPVDSSSVDTIISNCVINLSPDKSRVFREAHRVLKPQGKLVISDIVTEKVLPEGVRNDLQAWSCCVGGALEQQEYLAKIQEAGFGDLQVSCNRESFVQDGQTGEKVKMLSITVKAYKQDGKSKASPCCKKAS